MNEEKNCDERVKIKEKKVAPIAYNFENTKDKIQEANPNFKNNGKI